MREYYLENKTCHICTSEHVEVIDDMLLGRKLRGDGGKYTHSEIADFMRSVGLTADLPKISRHKKRHLEKAIKRMAALEATVKVMYDGRVGKASLLNSVKGSLYHAANMLLKSLTNEDIKDLDLETRLRYAERLVNTGAVIEQAQHDATKEEFITLVEQLRGLTSDSNKSAAEVLEEFFKKPRKEKSGQVN